MRYVAALFCFAGFAGLAVLVLTGIPGQGVSGRTGRGLVTLIETATNLFGTTITATTLFLAGGFIAMGIVLSNSPDRS